MQLHTLIQCTAQTDANQAPPAAMAMTQPAQPDAAAMAAGKPDAASAETAAANDGFGQILADALHQSKRRKLQAPSQSTDECNVNNKFEDNTDLQNPETPPKIPRPPTTPPPKVARQLDNMSNELKSLFVIARNLQRDRDCHKTSFLMCFTRLTNLQNNVNEMQNVEDLGSHYQGVC
jgi:hypothetical protein